MAEYLTVKDVARLMRVSQRTVARWIRLGWLRPVRIAHTIRFSRNHLLEQLDRHENGGLQGEDPSLG